MKIDVKKLECDAFVFSAHKMCGPCGVGVLWGKMEFLESLKPFSFGGDMIEEVGFECSTYNKVPYKFEAGTPNIEGVIGFGVAIDYLQKVDMNNIEKYERELCKYFLSKIKEVKDITIYGEG